jgi:hypothetical protein
MKTSRRIVRMRNVSGESCRENENTVFFPKIVLFMTQRGKNMVEPNLLRITIQYDHASYILHK